MAKLVSKVYGDALFEAARDCGKMDEIFEEVQSIGVILEENAELQKILGNPRVMREDKEQMIETIFRGRVSNEIVELMKLMISPPRMLYPYFSAASNTASLFPTRIGVRKLPAKRREAASRILSSVPSVKTIVFGFFFSS